VTRLRGFSFVIDYIDRPFGRRGASSSSGDETIALNAVDLEIRTFVSMENPAAFVIPNRGRRSS